MKIQHANPYYDDSYAVNSANLGPYGDAIETELMPAVEKKFRGIGQGWARFLYGGSTGGWESLAVQMFYPEHYNGAFVACPDPVDFHAFTRHRLIRRQECVLHGRVANKKVRAARDARLPGPHADQRCGTTTRTSRRWAIMGDPESSSISGRRCMGQSDRMDILCRSLTKRPETLIHKVAQLLARSLRPEGDPAAGMDDAGAEA